MITGSQCHAARVLVNLTREKLSSATGITEAAIRQFEHHLHEPDASTVQSLQSALEALGAVFIHAEDGGIGVRLKFGAVEARQVAQMEDEGGAVGSDTVL